VSSPPQVPQPDNRPDAPPNPSQMTGFERATLRWAKVAVLLSALAALLVCLQWWEMHQGGTDTHELAVAAKLQAQKAETISASMAQAVAQLTTTARATQQQVRAAQDSVKAVKRQMRQDQRPWIKVELGDPTPSGYIETRTEIGGPFKLPVRLSNTGKTPAQRVYAIVFLRIVQVGNEVKLPRFPPPWGREIDIRKLKKQTMSATGITSGTIFPGSHITEDVTRMETVDGRDRPQLFSATEAADLTHQNAYIVIYGQVRYFDGFGVRHWAYFCTDFFANGKNANFIKCSNFGDNDSN
jgi:hypothetical protein